MLEKDAFKNWVLRAKNSSRTVTNQSDSSAESDTSADTKVQPSCARLLHWLLNIQHVHFVTWDDLA